MNIDNLIDLFKKYFYENKIKYEKDIKITDRYIIEYKTDFINKKYLFIPKHYLTSFLIIKINNYKIPDILDIINNTFNFYNNYFQNLKLNAKFSFLFISENKISLDIFNFFDNKKNNKILKKITCNFIDLTDGNLIITPNSKNIKKQALKDRFKFLTDNYNKGYDIKIISLEIIRLIEIIIELNKRYLLSI